MNQESKEQVIRHLYHELQLLERNYIKRKGEILQAIEELRDGDRS